MDRSPYRRARPVVALCVVAIGCLAACGGTGGAPPTLVTQTLPGLSTQDALPPPHTAASQDPTTGRVPGSTASSGVPAGPGALPDPVLASPSTSGAKSDEQVITETFHTFTYLLSGLDDNLNSAWLEPLTEVTTERMAQAVTRHASAMLHAHEHGVGSFQARNVTVRMTGPASAALAECENYADFYLADDGTGTPDAGVVRGYFVGTAQLLKIHGRWYVDVYATTQTACDWSRQ